jgi:DNA-binding MarR family transcriptional regulator
MNKAPSEQFQPDSLPEIFNQIGLIEKKLELMQRAITHVAGLTPAQFAVLNTLWEKDAVPFKDLATASWCTPATMTGIVDSLEKKGLVTRQANPADRRSLLVCLTPAGTSIQSQVPPMGSLFQNCCDGLNAEEVRQLGQLLRKLDKSLETK